MSWLQRLFGGSDLSKLEQAVEKAAEKKNPGWYEVAQIKVHKENPITEYVVHLAPTDPPS
jgi:hypothetical protein